MKYERQFELLNKDRRFLSTDTTSQSMAMFMATNKTSSIHNFTLGKFSPQMQALYFLLPLLAVWKFSGFNSSQTVISE